MENEPQDNAGVIAPPPLIYLGPLALGLLLHTKFRVRILPRKPATILGMSLIGVSVMIVRLAFRELGRAHTTANPTLPTTALVVEGPFRYTRNPLYLSLSLFYAGVALLVNALWAMLLLPIVMIVVKRGVIEREEQYLERKFGEEYRRYKERVRRWI